MSSEPTNSDTNPCVLSTLQTTAWILLILVFLSTIMIMTRPQLHQQWKSWLERKDALDDGNNQIVPNANKIVTDKDLSPHAPRFVFFFRDNCPGCVYAKPFLLDYIKNRSPDGLKIILRDTNSPDQQSESRRITSVPKLLYQSNAKDDGEFFTGKFANYDQLDLFVKEKMRLGLNQANNVNTNSNDVNVTNVVADNNRNLDNNSVNWSNGYHKW